MEDLQEKGEQQGLRELEVGLEHHLVKEEELECHLGKGEGRECHLGEEEGLEYHLEKGEEQGCCCQEVEVEVEWQVLLGVVEVVGHQSQEVEEGQEHRLLLQEMVAVEEEEEVGLQHQVLPVVVEEVGEEVVVVLEQMCLVLRALLAVEVEQGWKQSQISPLPFCFALLVELF